MTDTPEDWVLIEAAKRCEWRPDMEPERIRLYDYEHNEAFRALCDMILKHEQPPVDRKLLCAREATKENDLKYWYKVSELERISVRAIELYLEGYGE
jgi:hypothetical protein